MNWIYIIPAILGYGFWGYAMKKASAAMPASSIQFVFLSVSSALAPLYFCFLKLKNIELKLTVAGSSWATLTSLSAMLASYMTLLALKETTSPGVVNAIICSYPAVTLVLTVLFLNETLSLQSCFGFVTLMTGIILLSSS